MYTLIIDHFETGLGRSLWLARINALTKENAKNKFKESFVTFKDDKAAWDYFSIGLDIYDDHIEEERNKAEKVLKSCLKKHFTESLLVEYIDFSMHFHYNFS